MMSSIEETKRRIRYRLYSELLRNRQSIPADLAAHFAVCKNCNGYGQVGYGFIKNQTAVEVDEFCPMCKGDGFIQIDHSK